MVEAPAAALDLTENQKETEAQIGDPIVEWASLAGQRSLHGPKGCRCVAKTNKAAE